MRNLFLSRACSLLLKNRGGRRLTVLIFHRVVEHPDPMRPSEPSIVEFSAQMEILRNYFNPISLSDALAHLDNNTLPEKSVCVTFDDGYSDNEELALPILQQFDIPACVFVATKYLDGGIMWNDLIIEGVRANSASVIDLSDHGLPTYPIQNFEQRCFAASSIIAEIKHFDPVIRERISNHVGQLCGAIIPDLMLSTAQLKKLAKAGVEIGGHTHSHPILASLDSESSKQEIIVGKNFLEQKIGYRLRYFAYPNGRPGVDYLPEHSSLVRELGFDAAMSTHWGVADHNTDRFQIPRFTPWDKVPLKFIVRMALNNRNVS